MACALARRGVRSGDRVAVVADKRVTTVVVLLATMRLGAIAVPINPRLVPAQVHHILDDSGARLLFAHAGALDRLDDGIAGGTALAFVVAIDDDLPGSGGEPDGDVSSGDELPNGDVPGDRAAAEREDATRSRTNAVSRLAYDAFVDGAEPVRGTADGIPAKANAAPALPRDDVPAAILYTSGSTARPKGVMLSASNLVHGAASVASYLGNHADDRLLALMPLSFDYGLSQVTTALTVGARAVLFDPLLPKGVVDAVVRHRITGLPAVPHLWNRLAALDWPPVPHLRYVTNTGGRLSAETIRRLAERLPGTDIVPMYGFTEAFRSTRLPPGEVARRPDSIGRAVPHAKVLVVAPDGRECAPGEVGELIHGGPLVALGYWGDEAATRAKFRPRFADGGPDAERFAWSGDLARRDEAGFLYFESRREELLKLHGYRVNPAEIEEVIMRADAVRDVCVIGVPHPALGQAAVALVVAEVGGAEAGDAEGGGTVNGRTAAGTINERTLAAVGAHCRTELPSFMIPEHLAIVQTLPDNPNGKVDRRALQARWKALFERSSIESSESELSKREPSGSDFLKSEHSVSEPRTGRLSEGEPSGGFPFTSDPEPSA